MADQSMDVSLYTRAPRINTTNGLSLAQQLKQALPADAPSWVVTAGTKLWNTAEVLGAAFGVEAGAAPLSPKQTDRRLDRAWGALESRLASWSALTEEANRVDRERAAELHQKFFPEGLLFLTFEFLSEHAESEKRIKWIIAEVETDLIRLVQEPFITNLRQAHAAYGVALGITSPVTAAASAKVAAPLRALQAAIANYSMQVVAWYSNLDEGAADYEAQVQAIRSALAPIDKFRDGHPATEGGGGAGGGAPPAA